MPLVCRAATLVEVQAADCAETRAVYQPCAGLLVPISDVLDGDEAAADLGTCRLHRQSEARTATEQLAALQIALDAETARADAHGAELDRVRGAMSAARWTLWRIAGVVLATGVAVAAGVPCARGAAGWCAVSGAGVGAGVTLAVW